MAEILGLGLTHYPPLLGVDEAMAWVLEWTLQDPDIPADKKDPANWPEEMQREWGDDHGTAEAACHREALVAGFRHVRATLDEFAPDVVLMFGDDQYENFQEDVIPPFSLLAYEDMDVQPWKAMKRRHGTNVWGESEEATYRVRGARDVGVHLATELLQADFDVSYAYKPLHQVGLSHSFMNALMFLDYDRTGLDYPLLPVQVNCYGRRVISFGGTVSRFADAKRQLDPPAPSPSRCLALGAAIGRALKASPWRVAVVASSSWSHTFLTDSTWRLYPDHDSDRALFDGLAAGNYESWHRTSLADLEAAGQQEMLNWFCLVGAMEALGVVPDWAEFVGTYAFNSNKVFATFPVA